MRTPDLTHAHWTKSSRSGANGGDCLVLWPRSPRGTSGPYIFGRPDRSASRKPSGPSAADRPRHSRTVFTLTSDLAEATVRTSRWRARESIVTAIAARRPSPTLQGQRSWRAATTLARMGPCRKTPRNQYSSTCASV